MKYTINGFSQEEAVGMGLSVEDLAILRWFVDFWPSPLMLKMSHEGKQYALVSYKGFIDQMPIIGCNKRTIARKFQKLVEAEVLENVTIKQGGSFSVYRFGRNYERLVQNCTTPDKTVHTVDEDCTEGMYRNVQPGMDENVHTKTNLYKSTNQLKTNSSNTIRFTPPSLDDVRAYCQERHNSISPERFVDYYQSNGWMVGKSHMKDWKAAVRTWEGNQKKETNENPARKELAEGEIVKSGGITWIG